VVAEQLAATDPRRPIVEREFLKRCLGVGHQQRLQKRIHSTESISRELFANGLKLAANRDLVDPGREEVARGRETLAHELRVLVARVQRIRELALAPRA
jgi:glycerol-3-phosphate O-acyltransferase